MKRTDTRFNHSCLRPIGDYVGLCRTTQYRCCNSSKATLSDPVEKRMCLSKSELAGDVEAHATEGKHTTNITIWNKSCDHIAPMRRNTIAMRICLQVLQGPNILRTSSHAFTGKLHGTNSDIIYWKFEVALRDLSITQTTVPR